MLTEDIINNSIYFPDISIRFENFSKDNLLTISYTDVIVDFNATLIGSSLRAKYILFEQNRKQGYNHLCVAEDKNGGKYAESFFYNPTDLYIKNQKTIKVKRVRIFDDMGVLYFEDELK